MSILIDKETIIKHDIPGPRYTSYPTAPVWSTSVTEKEYIEKLKAFGSSDKTLSLYLHVPFCETMCTYCACSVIIRRKDRKYADEYIAHVEKEMKLIFQYTGQKKKVKQLHWGGGTPTFMEEDQMEEMFSLIRKYFDIDPSGVLKNKLHFFFHMGDVFIRVFPVFPADNDAAGAVGTHRFTERHMQI
jgi:oxygen-independent coproporphyrinogen-3 oxidase